MRFRKISIITLYAWAGLFLATHLLGYFIPMDALWGLAFYAQLPLALGIIGGLIAVSTLFLPINRFSRRKVTETWQSIARKLPADVYFALMSILAMPAFWLLRIRHLNWGDANILVVGLSQKDAPVLYNWQAPFTVFLHQRLWQLWAEPTLGWGVDTVYAAVSVLCGGLFVFFALKLSQALGDNFTQRATVAGIILTGGAMQLFFGYIENYTVISLGIIVFLWFGLRAARGQSPLWYTTFALSLTNAFHPSTIVLWGAPLYLAWKQYRAGQSQFDILQAILLPPLLVGSVVLSMMEWGNHGLSAFSCDDRPGVGDHIWFVPLSLDSVSEWQRYAMFSWGHFLDWGNEVLLTMPFAAPLLALAGAKLWRMRAELSEKWKTQTFFLGIAGVGYLLLTWAWNADYGIQKDWDLFSPASFVVNLLAGVLWIRAWRNDKSMLSKSAFVVIAMGGWHTLAWVLSNAFWWG